MTTSSGDLVRLTNHEHLEALATRSIPQPFDAHVRALLAITDKMRDAASTLGISRRFTLDGRLLGDLGEVIAHQHFGIDLHETQKEGEDATCTISGKTVELKLRRTGQQVFVKRATDILTVIYLSPETLRWGIVCNGPAKELLANAVWDAGPGRYCTTLTKLRLAHLRLPPDCVRLVERTGNP